MIVNESSKLLIEKETGKSNDVFLLVIRFFFQLCIYVFNLALELSDLSVPIQEHCGL